MIPAACTANNVRLAAWLRDLDQFDRDTLGMGYFNPNLIKHKSFGHIFKERRKR